MSNTSLATESQRAGKTGRWHLLPPLPDAVGFGGMFAGVLGERLVVGGGSQFSERPSWLGGQKRFSDRIFSLAHGCSSWDLESLRLPVPRGHFASACTPEGIYIAGGVDDTGVSAEVFEISLRESGLVCRRLPDLPVACGYATGAWADGRLYVIGGSTSAAPKSAVTAVWSLAPGDDRWRQEPDVPGDGVFVAASTSVARDVFLFGGMSFSDTNGLIPRNAAYRLDSGARQWRRLRDLPEPRVAAASPCATFRDRIFIIGGYSEIFSGPPREHPGFNAQILVYDLVNNNWTRGLTLPQAPVPNRDSTGDTGPAPMIAAPCVTWREKAIIVSGEVRASVRSPAVIAVALE